jgi:hypothetical protein
VGNKAPILLLQNILTTLVEKLDGLELSEAVIIIIVPLVAVYFTALLFSKKTRCIIICGWPDLLLMALPELLIGFVWIFNGFIAANYELTPIEFDNVLLNILFTAPIIITLGISVVSNLKNNGFPAALLYIFISILGKLIVMILIGLFLVCFIAVVFGKRETVRKYRETKDRRRTRMTEHQRSQRRASYLTLLLVMAFVSL